MGLRFWVWWLLLLLLLLLLVPVLVRLLVDIDIHIDMEVGVLVVVGGECLIPGPCQEGMRPFGRVLEIELDRLVVGRTGLGPAVVCWPCASWLGSSRLSGA